MSGQDSFANLLNISGVDSKKFGGQSMNQMKDTKIDTPNKAAPSFPPKGNLKGSQGNVQKPCQNMSNNSLETMTKRSNHSAPVNGIGMTANSSQQSLATGSNVGDTEDLSAGFKVNSEDFDILAQPVKPKQSQLQQQSQGDPFSAFDDLGSGFGSNAFPQADSVQDQPAQISSKTPADFSELAANNVPAPSSYKSSPNPTPRAQTNSELQQPISQVTQSQVASTMFQDYGDKAHSAPREPNASAMGNQQGFGGGGGGGGYDSSGQQYGGGQGVVKDTASTERAAPGRNMDPYNTQDHEPDMEWTYTDVRGMSDMDGRKGSFWGSWRTKVSKQYKDLQDQATKVAGQVTSQGLKAVREGVTYIEHKLETSGRIDSPARRDMMGRSGGHGSPSFGRFSDSPRGSRGPFGSPRVEGAYDGTVGSVHVQMATLLKGMGDAQRMQVLAQMPAEDRNVVESMLSEQMVASVQRAEIEREQEQKQSPKQREQQVDKNVEQGIDASNGYTQQQFQPKEQPTPTAPDAEPALATAPAQHAPEIDLLGMTGSSIAPDSSAGQRGGAGQPFKSGGQTQQARSADVSSTQRSMGTDLLGMFDEGGVTQRPATGGPTTTQQGAGASAASSSGMDKFFAAMGEGSGGGGPAPKARANFGGNLMGFDDEVDIDTTGYDNLYEQQAGEAGEPEVRRRLREMRLAEQHVRMRDKLAEKRARDQQDKDDQAQQVELRDQFRPIIEDWAKVNKGNIVGLLTALDKVLDQVMPGQNWTRPAMTQLLEYKTLRKVYMKANLIVHPDKIKQREGSPVEMAAATMIFDVLKEGWSNYQTQK